jgi:hypothetical protein
MEEKGQAYGPGRKGGIAPTLFLIKKPPKAMKLGAGVRVQEKIGEKQEGQIVDQVSLRTWMV